MATCLKTIRNCSHNGLSDGGGAVRQEPGRVHGGARRREVAINAGYAIKTVWANVCEDDRIDLSYKTFLNYVRRVLGPVLEQGTVSPIKPQSPATFAAQPLPHSSTVSTPTRVMPLPMPGFTYRPIPNKEESL